MKIRALKTLPILLAALFSSASCSVISRDIRSEALPKIPFEQLLQEADRYAGQTVILGGYILENESAAGGTLLKILQAPLDPMEEPMSKDLSQGRFIVYNDRYLDPEVFQKNRAITVAGTVLPFEGDKGSPPYLRIKSREIHLWPQYGRSYYPYSGYYPYPGFIPFSYPYGYVYPYGHPGYRFYPYYWR